MRLNLYFTMLSEGNISIQCSTVEVGEGSKIRSSIQESAPVIDLATVREKLKCKRCDGLGIIAVEIPLKTIADSYGIEGRTCPRCHGKGFCKKD